MPIYKHICPNGHEFDLHLKFAELNDPQFCTCGELTERVICAPALVLVQNIAYTSPIDGKPITTKQARIEDLKRNGCIEYEPGMKQDHQRRLKEQERALDKSVDESVERAVATMPPLKLEKLAAELHQGVDVAPIRTTREA